MYIQPRGYKRTSRGAALIDQIDKQICSIAARFNCSKSFVIATLLAEHLGIKEQVTYYEVYERNQERDLSSGSKNKVVGIKSRKRSHR